jgi:hypothetical protein
MLPETGEDLLERAAAGKRLALAWAESPHGRPDVLPGLHAEAQNDGTLLLCGTKIAVIGAAGAEVVLCTARLSDDFAIVAIPGEIERLKRTSYRTIAGEQVQDLALDDVRLPLDSVLATGETARAAVLAGFDLALVTACAEMVGSLRASVELTVRYLAERKQFGRPLAEFQVLQHRVVDMLIVSEEARSLLHYALSKANSTPEERARAASACKLYQRS